MSAEGHVTTPTRYVDAAEIRFAYCPARCSCLITVPAMDHWTLQ
jgi:hypothetical protein